MSTISKPRRRRSAKDQLAAVGCTEAHWSRTIEWRLTFPVFCAASTDFVVLPIAPDHWKGVQTLEKRLLKTTARERCGWTVSHSSTLVLRSTCANNPAPRQYRFFLLHWVVGTSASQTSKKSTVMSSFWHASDFSFSIDSRTTALYSKLEYSAFAVDLTSRKSNSNSFTSHLCCDVKQKKRLRLVYVTIRMVVLDKKIAVIRCCRDLFIKMRWDHAPCVCEIRSYACSKWAGKTFGIIMSNSNASCIVSGLTIMGNGQTRLLHQHLRLSTDWSSPLSSQICVTFFCDTSHYHNCFIQLMQQTLCLRYDYRTIILMQSGDPTNFTQYNQKLWDYLFLFCNKKRHHFVFNGKIICNLRNCFWKRQIALHCVNFQMSLRRSIMR